ncbi:hypothetical protein BSLA_01f3525 [Burkholderia stabilis]|nr:hypothetical protein BSLA_01f3525 [Burkholderia stabilis]
MRVPPAVATEAAAPAAGHLPFMSVLHAGPDLPGVLSAADIH